MRSCQALRCLLAWALVSVLIMIIGDRLPAGAADVAEIKIGYLRQALSKQQPISLLDQTTEDDGIAGARLAIADNNGTGRFANQRFALEDVILAPQDDAAARRAP